MRLRFRHMFRATCFGAVLATFAMLLRPAWFDQSQQHSASGKTGPLLTFHTLPLVPDLAHAGSIDPLVMTVPSELLETNRAGSAGIVQRDNNPDQAPASNALITPPSATRDGATAPAAGNGAVVYGDYSGRIGNNGKLTVRRTGDTATQQLDIDLIGKRSGVKVKIPF